MNNRRSDGWGRRGGGGWRCGGPLPVEADNVGRGGGRGQCRLTGGEEFHGAGWDGIPRGGGRGRCWGGGYGYAMTATAAEGAAVENPWQLVEALRRRVETLEGRVREATPPGAPPAPDAR
jgi:hypothetical protein